MVASQWMVWLGALALGLSAVFLFRHAVDQGWLTPMLRVVLGLVLGGAFLSGGEFTRARPVSAAARIIDPSLIPTLLTGTGLFAIFVSLFAAHALYGLLGPETAFVALGLTAYAALGLSLRHGPFLALTGLIAGFTVPALIDSADPQATPLFLYLFVLSAGCLSVMFWRNWRWFSYLTLAGSLAWPLFWLAGRWTPADQGALGAYALGLAASFALLSRDMPLKSPPTPVRAWIAATVRNTSGLGFTLFGGLIVFQAMAADFNAAAFVFIFMYCAFAIALAMWRPSLEGLIVVAALIALAALLVWPQPATVSTPARVEDLGVASLRDAFGPFVMPPEFVVYSRALWAIAGLFGLGGFAGLWRARSPEVWAAVSASAPIVLFAVAYWRIGAFDIDIAWAWVAAGPGLAALAAATAVGRRSKPPRLDAPLAFYAAAATTAMALAFACLLREAWLTVAISLQVLALAWIWTRIPVEALRHIAAAVTAVVLVRLLANPFLLDYQGTVFHTFGWVLYGYGIPALSIGAASRVFARSDRDVVVTLCEAAAIALAALMVSLQLRLWTAGSLREPAWSLFDTAVQTIWWMLVAALLLRKPVAQSRPWLGLGGLVALYLSCAVVFLFQVLSNSPMLSGEPVGGLPLLNLLALAYLAPAALVLSIAGSGRFAVPHEHRSFLGGFGGVLLFVYFSLETRRAFWGSQIVLGPGTEPSNAEIYAYSAVWIAFALALLATGIWRRSHFLRYASLAVLVVTAAKVFLYDMSDLVGLFRVASFLGLGVTLIVIARIYQRFVFGRDASKGA